MTTNFIFHLRINCFRGCDEGNGMRFFSEFLRKAALSAADASQNERDRPVRYWLHGLPLAKAQYAQLSGII